MKLRISCCLMSIVCFSSLIGCGDSKVAESRVEAKHEHDEHGDAQPKNFSEALAEVESMKQTICKAFQDGKPDDAHHELHEVGEVLEMLGELAAKDRQLSSEQIDTFNKNIEQLFKGFGKLDSQLHGGEKADAKAIEAELTGAISSLRDVVK